MYQRIICLMLLAVALSSCFHKSNQTGTADDVRDAMVCHTAGGDVLITHEQIFHATSKSYNKGMSYVSGVADYRYTVRDLKTGVQVVRLVTGDVDKDFVILGFDGASLWCYCADKGVGLHARNPATLAVTVTQQQIEQANPQLAGKLNPAKLNEVERYYSWDALGGRLTATDMQGNICVIDPAGLHATTIAKMPDGPKPYHATATSCNVDDSRNYSIGGDLRRQIRLPTGDAGTETYLNGTFIVEQDASRLAAAGRSMLQAHRNEMALVERERDSLLKAYPVLTDERQAFLTIKDYHIPSRYSSLRSSLERMIRDSADKHQSVVRKLSNFILGDSNGIYIVHAANVTDTASVLISRVSIHGSTATTDWTTLVPGIYFTPTKGILKNPMKEVFKAGNPHFDREWFGIQGDVLVGVRMLFAFGIDSRTGRLLWKQQL